MTPGRIAFQLQRNLSNSPPGVNSRQIYHGAISENAKARTCVQARPKLQTRIDQTRDLSRKQFETGRATCNDKVASTSGRPFRDQPRRRVTKMRRRACRATVERLRSCIARNMCPQGTSGLRWCVRSFATGATSSASTTTTTSESIQHDNPVAPSTPDPALITMT